MIQSFRTSRKVRRAALAILGVMVVVHLSGITYWRATEVGTSLGYFVGLWIIGLVALALLVRAWLRV